MCERAAISVCVLFRGGTSQKIQLRVCTPALKGEEIRLSDQITTRPGPCRSGHHRGVYNTLIGYPMLQLEMLTSLQEARLSYRCPRSW